MQSPKSLEMLVTTEILIWDPLKNINVHKIIISIVLNTLFYQEEEGYVRNFSHFWQFSQSVLICYLSYN